MQTLRWTVLLIVTVVIFVCVGLLFQGGRAAMKRASAEHARRHGNPIPVRTVLVAQWSVDEVVGATALTEASRTTAVRIAANRLSPSREFKATAVLVKNVHIAEGTYVHEGDLLFELDEDALEQVVKQREAEWTAASAELELAKQSTALNEKIRELELASSHSNLDFRNEALTTRANLLEQAQTLYGKSSATSLQVLEAKAALAQANFDLTEAKHRLQRAEDSLAIGALRDKSEVEVAAAKFVGARLALEMSRKDALACQIKSPATGFVTAVTVAPGEIVDTSVELTKILRLDPVFVRVDFPQERIDELEVGQSVEVVLDSFPKEKFLGKVIRIPPQANYQLRVLPIVVELGNPGNRIKAGLSGFARVHVATKPTTVVPATAVIERGGRAMTFQVEDGHARIRQIQTGPLVDNGWVEVRSGLEPGGEVVVYGTENLRDGDPVDVDWRRWARRD